MKFFEKCRPEFYFHGARLVKDAKTQIHFWRMNLVVTCKAEEMAHCDEIVLNNFIAIETRSNKMMEIAIDHTIKQQRISFFSLGNSDSACQVISGDLSELRMTRAENKVEDLVELWLRVEVEKSDRLSRFVCDHIFTRMWAEFEPLQQSLGLAEAVKDAVAEHGAENVAAVVKLVKGFRDQRPGCSLEIPKESRQ